MDRPGSSEPDPEGDLEAQVVIRQVSAEDHFAISVGRITVGRADYRDRPGGVRVFTHTEIHPAYGGRGLAATLIRHALDVTRAAGLRIRPSCPYVRAFVDEHPDYADLVGEPTES